MSLNCLSCGGYTMSPSVDDTAPIMPRCWSGELTPPPYAHLRSRSIAGNPDDKKKIHRKVSSTGSPLLGGMEVREAATDQPRLVRSRGMRRDWSFEDLRNRKANVVKV
ncbi:hypothetical protein Cni_G01425 [Canna indica]|uniref:Uncharacterized protein n=1 Tax=Canna indica TaxID=4628 RepID=A0AAQ3JMH2_9LILI|nr:hypothetical protein Cni_G01425 [Canna indica]